MAIFTLPTSGPATYRGKYPARARSVSHSRAAHIRREAAGLPGYDAAAEESRAILESILSPDERAETVKAELFAAYGTDRAELEAEAKAAAPVRLVQTRGPDGESRLVRRDNVEYHAGKAAFAAGEAQEDCPYCAGGERAARWNLGWREAAKAADEREAAEADERAAKVSPDAARALGAQSCACNLDRSANPFPADSAAGEAWDSGYSEAMADWRAERRAEIADQYGDEAADHF